MPLLREKWDLQRLDDDLVAGKPGGPQFFVDASTSAFKRHDTTAGLEHPLQGGKLSSQGAKGTKHDYIKSPFQLFESGFHDL